jgi:hypothetical protein
MAPGAFSVETISFTFIEPLLKLYYSSKRRILSEIRGKRK